MKSFSSLSFIIYSILSFMILCQTVDIDVKKEKQTFSYHEDKKTIKFKVKISPKDPKNYKFIEIKTKLGENKALLYLSLKEEDPNPKQFDISAANEGNNQIYVPRTYFEKNDMDSFYMSSECEGNCNFNISFQLVEKMHAERSVRLDFLTFDDEEYLIYFDKNLTDTKSQLMVTASGGAKSHYHAKNNVELTLSYVYEEGNSTIEINVNSKIMFNGAVTTFLEEPYQNLGEGHYLAKVKAPSNTYIIFMVRQFNIINDLPVDGKAIYGFLQGNDTDKFQLKGFNNENFGVDNANKIIQVSILVKGYLIISKSSEQKLEETLHVKDESQILLTFTSEELSNNITHICIQTKNEYSRVNAYIMEVHDVTDQKTQTIVTEPLVNGYIYEDKLKLDEVRSYRHSKYQSSKLIKYNCKLKQGIIKVAIVKCSSFPKCNLNKEIIEGKKSEESIELHLLTSIDNYYTENVNINFGTNPYSPVQNLLAVVCLTEKCIYEVSFSDEDDYLLLKENNRIAHYISQGSSNYYHFKIPEFENIQKVFVYLRTISGDTNIDVLDDATERKRYFFENTKILEFYEYEFTGLYTLNITGNIGSFYLLSYSILRNNEIEENTIHIIDLGMSFISGIKNGHNYKKFKIPLDKTRGKNLRYLSTFYPINCNIKVVYNEKEEINFTNGIFQHEIEIDTTKNKSDYLEYQVINISSGNGIPYENKFCFFHVMTQEISPITESIINEGVSIDFILTPNTNQIGFVYPHSAGEKDIYIKYNLENNYIVDMIIKIDENEQKKLTFSRSSSHVINASELTTNCYDISNVCGINIHIEAHNYSTNFTIPISFKIKSDDITPSSLVKNKLQVDLVTENTIQYYMVEIDPEDKGEIMLNFKKGSGIMFAKIVGKDADPEENSNWNNRVRLPKEGEKEESVGEFNRYKNKIKYDASKLYKYGQPVCKNGCELYIGVISTDNTNENQNDCLEYSIYIRPEMNISSDLEDYQKLINKVRVDILANEYITGYIDNSSDIHYYFFEVPDDSESIEIEFQSESCTLYINNGSKFPVPSLNVTGQEVNAKISSTIKIISNKDLGLNNLKGVEFRIAVNTKNYDELMSMMYIFRIRTVKNSTNNVIEINSNLATVCEIEYLDKYCDLIYPISDYEFNAQSSLFVYAETEIFSEIIIYFKPIISYDFDKLTEEEKAEKLPRQNNSRKSTEKEEIKSYLEIEPNDLKNEKNVKSYALISIKTNRPGIVNIYTYMRQQVTHTALNPYSKLLFQRKEDATIYFITEGDQAYNFHIRCINGEAYAYLKNNDDEGKEISGHGSQFSMALPKKKKDELIIKATSNDGIIFYIYENIHPEVRSMELIEFGIPTKINFDDKNKANFPLIYYMKMKKGISSINLNIHINNLKTDFEQKDGDNYTNIFDIFGCIVDESMIKSMMKNKRKNPPKKEVIIGRYDKSLSMAKLYYDNFQLKNIKDLEYKYLVLNLNKNQHMEGEIKSMKMIITVMPFNDLTYECPNNIYIAGNLMKDIINNPDIHRITLRPGNQGDKYMQIELGILSSNVYFKISVSEKNYNGTFTLKNGKYKGIVEVQDKIKLEFCREEGIKITHEESLNYIFKITSKKDKNFTNYKLNDDNVDHKFNHQEKQISLNLTIPKVLNENESLAMTGEYFIRLYAKSALKDKVNLKTISFISYFAYATYIYKITEITEIDNSTKSFNYIIENFPGDQAYIVSIIAVIKDGDKEEIFAYEPIEYSPGDEKKDEVKKDNNTLKIVLLSVGISVGAILVGIAIYFFVRMMKKKKELDNELSKIVGIETDELDQESKEAILL